MPIAILFMFVALAIITPVLIHGMQQNNQLILGTVTARQMHQVTKAAQDYITAYATNIEASSTATSPATITIPMLESTGFLPSGFQATNPYGQTWEVQVLQPNPGQLQALVLSIGGQTIAPADGPRIGAEAGSRGGTVTASGTAQGSYAGWQVSLTNYTNPGVGHLASLLYFNNGSLENDYLYRVSVPGQPQLNMMSTALNMGANDINNAQDVNVNQNIVAGPAGGGCVMDADGHCTGEISAAGTPETDMPANWWGGITTDDLHARGTVAVGPPGAYQANINDFATGVASSGGAGYFSSPNGANAVSISTSNSGANITSTGTVTADYAFVPGTAGGGANIGWGCGPNGEIAANANGTGQLLSCQGGAWVAPGSYSFVVWQGWVNGPSTLTWANVCAQSGMASAGWGGGWSGVSVNIYPIAGPNGSGQYLWYVGGFFDNLNPFVTCFDLT